MNFNNFIDDVDKNILVILQENGKITNVQLAAKVGLSPPAVLERVKKLEERGIIEKYVAILNEKSVGKRSIAYVSVSLSMHQLETIENFRKKILECPDVLECYHIAGEDDYLLKIANEDIDSYEQFLLHTLTKIPGINKIKTTFVLSTIKKDTMLPLG
jgi:Lrp/AsnC family leucine-responsive transcriptional regulator